MTEKDWQALSPEEINRLFATSKGAISSDVTSGRPSLASVRFDTAGYQYRGQQAAGRDHIWSTPEGDLVALRYCPGSPGFVENARSVEELRAGLESRKKATSGQVVEVRVRRTKSRPAIQVIFKMPRNSGWTYFGTLCVPFRDFGFVIQAECHERGMTGMREVMVMYFHNIGETRRIPQAVPPCLPWDPDNARFDHLFSDHPLSRLRRFLNRVSDSVEIEAAILELPGFSLPESGV